MDERAEHQVFLSHASTDKPVVRELALSLRERGVTPWLDEWNLVPGVPWQEGIEEALNRSASCAVCLGPSGMGPWQHEEMRAAIERRVADPERRFRVIPVLLPGAERGERSRLPDFLRRTTWVEFRTTLADEVALHRLICGIRGVEPGPLSGEVAVEGICPYRGLRAFDVDDSQLFYGREAQVEWLLDRLRPTERAASRFLALVGPSGSGKSSLARAGLLAALKRGEFLGSAAWPIALFKPGPQPLESLAVALGGSGAYAGRLIQDLAQDPRALHRETRTLLRDAPEEQRYVVLVDQFEEVFTLCADEAQRRSLIGNLMVAAREVDGQTVVILTLRSDYYGRCAEYSELAAALSDRQVLVEPMRADELRRAIEKPTHLAGCEVQEGLTDLLLEEVRDQPGTLPLLQHCLLELWERREGRRLTLAAYRRVGGVKGALEQHAEGVYARLALADREVCRRVFLRLVQIGEETVVSRRRRFLADLRPAHGPEENERAVKAVVAQLAADDARLLTTEATPNDPRPTIDLAHEALIEGWKRFGEWIERDREARRVHQRLETAANEWIGNARDSSFLYRGSRLAQADEWARQHTEELNPAEKEYLEASLALRSAERRWSTLRIAGLTVAATVALVAIGIGWYRLRVAENQRLRSLGEDLARRAHQSGQPTLKLLLALEAARLADRAGGSHLPPVEEALRNALTGIRGLPLGAGKIRGFGLSPNRSLLVTLGVDGTLRLFDLTAADPPSSSRVVAGWAKAARALTVSEDGGWLLIACDVGSTLFRVEDGMEFELPEEDWVPGSHPFSPDNRWLVTRKYSQFILRQLQGATLDEPTAVLDYSPTAWSFGSDGENLAITEQNGVIHVLELKLGERPFERFRLVARGGVRQLGLSGGGRWLVATYAAEGLLARAEAWESAETGTATLRHECLLSAELCAKSLARAGVPSRSIADAFAGWGIAVSPDGEWLAAERRGYGVLSRLSDEAETALATGGEATSSLAFAGQGRWLFTQRGDEAPRLVGVQGNHSRVDREPSVVVYPPGEILAISGAGQRVLQYLYATRDIRVLDAEAEPLSQPLAGAEGASSPWAFSATGHWVAAQGPAGTIRAWQLNPQFGVVRALSLSTQPHRLSALMFDAAERWLASGDENGKCSISRLPDLKVRWEARNHDGGVTALAFSPRAELFATAGADGKVRVYAISEQGLEVKNIWELQDLAGEPPSGLTFSADSRWLAVGRKDGQVTLWDRESSVKIPLEAVGKNPRTLAFSQGGDWLASGSDLGVHLWRFAGKETLRRPVQLWGLELGSNETHLGFSPDWQKLTSVATGSTVKRSWELSFETVRATGCRIAGRNLIREEWQTYLPGERFSGREPCPELPPAHK